VTDGGTGATRLPTLQGTRSDLYRVAVDAGAAHPLRGEGAGAFGVRYAHDRALVQEVRNAHSLYLETWAERGLVGVGLLGVLVAAVLRAAWSRRRRTSRLGRTEAAAAGAAVVVGLVHAGMDWDWQMPALTGVVLLLAAVVLAPVRSSHRLSA
jgi:O-antigen ligase